MAYLTKAEYLKRFDEAETISLTDPTNTTIDDERLNEALAAGEAMVDSYTAARYGSPLDPVPVTIKAAVGDLAREDLYSLRPVEEVTKRADRVRTWLKDVSKGVAELAVGGALVEEESGDEPETYTPDPIFSNAILGAYQGRMRTWPV